MFDLLALSKQKVQVAVEVGISLGRATKSGAQTASGSSRYLALREGSLSTISTNFIGVA